MDWAKGDIDLIQRENNFPLNVCKVYYCCNAKFPFSGEYHRLNCYEISLRLKSDEARCHDHIGDDTLDIPFPHAVLKTPEMRLAINGSKPRDTIAFSYPVSSGNLLRQWGLFPEKKFFEINMDGILPLLVERFKQFCTSGMIEKSVTQLDALCFQILNEIIFNPPNTIESMDAADRIKRVAGYIQHHCDRPLTVENIARKFGFSRAAFYREWAAHFPTPPKEYILYSRLETAALRLIYSRLPIADIAREVHFSGVTAFYRKFQARYGFSPGELRKKPELWKRFAPDLMPGNHE